MTDLALTNNLSGKGTAVTTDPRKHILHFSRHDDINSYIAEAMPTEKRRRRWVEYRKRWYQADDMQTLYDWPIELNLELTDACNLACEHCYQLHRTIPQKKIMRMDLVRQLVDEGAEKGLESFVIGTTDESMLHKQAIEILDYAVKKEIPDVWLFSNGTLFTREKIIRILEAGPTRISISVDAATQETYAKVRGDDLGKVHRSIETILEERDRRGLKLPILRLTYIRKPETVAEMERFVEQWGDKVDQIDFQIYWDPSWVEALPFKTAAHDFECAQPWKQILVLANGDILPCCSEFARHMILGNAGFMTISEAWRSPAMEEVRRSLVEHDYKIPCVNCLGNKPRYADQLS